MGGKWETVIVSVKEPPTKCSDFNFSGGSNCSDISQGQSDGKTETGSLLSTRGYLIHSHTLISDLNDTAQHSAVQMCTNTLKYTVQINFPPCLLRIPVCPFFTFYVILKYFRAGELNARCPFSKSMQGVITYEWYTGRKWLCIDCF